MKIVIPYWMRQESPICAGFCDVINEALEENPEMSLAEFAANLSQVNIEGSLERLEKAEKQQFGDAEKRA